MKRGTLAHELGVPKALRVEVVGGASDVVLQAHGEGKARVEMRYTIRGWGSRAEALERELRKSPPVHWQEGVLRVGPEPEGVELDYTLFLPAEAEVEVEVGSGDVTARGFSKRLRIVTGSGDVELMDLTGEVRLRCGSGDVALTRVFGALDLRTGSGDIQGWEVKGYLDVETGSGDVALDGVEGELRILTGSGDVRVEGQCKEETWRIRTSSGDVHLALFKGAQAELDLRTEFGDLTCALPFSAEEWREGRLRGRLGEAPRGRIQVETETGDIALSLK
ncbi:MAG: DUF4097 domain-containing protein [Candidatus Bipolaricaulota bacterium]|nr:DUF4097 domain-containing protein [Candidatus Bipolaricaulota bacterium]MDW8152031.1 DUF4097 family beta strand repeat-containing protein [Candidatus Bipolaricaulota bacterium]